MIEIAALITVIRTENYHQFSQTYAPSCRSSLNADDSRTSSIHTMRRATSPAMHGGASSRVGATHGGAPTHSARRGFSRHGAHGVRPSRALVGLACAIFLLATRALLRGTSRGEMRARKLECVEPPSAWSVSDAMLRNNELTRASEALRTTGFTVILNTYERRAQLKRAVKHYSKCRGVEGIRVTWSEQTAPPVEGVDTEYFVQYKVGFVRYRAYEGTTIQNRFEPYDDIGTRAVFNVDDDVWMPCDALYRGFSDWKKSPDALVGYFPRDYAPATSPPDGCTWKYVANELKLWRTRRYSIILTKAAFMDQKYLKLYKEKLPEGVREYIDKQRNCEDIAMQFLVSSVSREPVKFTRASFFYYLRAKIGGAGLSGISKSSDHKIKRGDCITDFQTMFGATSIPLTEAFW